MSSGRFPEVKNRKFLSVRPKRVRGRLVEVVAYKRFLPIVILLGKKW